MGHPANRLRSSWSSWFGGVEMGGEAAMRSSLVVGSVCGIGDLGDDGIDTGEVTAVLGGDSPPFIKLEIARIMPAPGLRLPTPPALHGPSVSGRRECGS